ncbi:MAG: hypothetical protein P8X74_16205 [Reinekea sp.]
MLPQNVNEPMPPAIFEKQIKIRLLPPASTLESRIQVLDCCSKSLSARVKIY